MVAHNPEAGITRIKLPSGSKKVSCCRRGMRDLPARALYLFPSDSMALPHTDTAAAAERAEDGVRHTCSVPSVRPVTRRLAGELCQ